MRKTRCYSLLLFVMLGSQTIFAACGHDLVEEPVGTPTETAPEADTSPSLATDAGAALADTSPSADQTSGGTIYYFGYTEGHASDPAPMIANGKLQVNRIKDALQTRGGFGGHTIKTSDGYAALVSGIDDLKGKATGSSDTAVIYLHTHGGPKGLSVSKMLWSELATRVLTIPAGNVLVFLATCNSGAGVSAFASSGWQSKSGQNFAAFSIVDDGETGTFSPGPPPINPLSDNVIFKIKNVTMFDGLADLPSKVQQSFAAFGLTRNPKMASSWKVSRPIW